MSGTWQERAHPGANGRGLVHRASGLLGQALASDDAEACGLRADDMLLSGEVALVLLGSPDAWPAARHAVVQRYGRVGALLVVGYEGRWRARNGESGPPNPPEMEQLLDRFAHLDAEELQQLLAHIDQAEGVVEGDNVAQARRWLHCTYAVAARDGTDSAHRAYMEALDHVMRLAARRLAS